jgi:uncharacterized protein YjbI with pentapeptide repeats
MKKLVILQFDGDFSTGYKVTLEVGDDGERPDVRKRGELPPALDVVRSFQEWRKIYGSKHGQSRIKVNAVKNLQTVEYKQQCEQYSQQLLSIFNTWLESESFNSISNYLSDLNTNKEQELRIILSCERLELRKLPWHLWDLCSWAEVALSAPDAARGVRILREKIRILIILGDSTGINVKADEMLLQKYCRDAEIVTLVEPSREELNCYLQDKIGWDILFFSGHSQTHNFTATSEERAVQGRIFVNKKDSLTMAQLRDSLQTAIQQRLQLAIFNSCDGLGIAAELESLQIPQVIVMREPVPDFVAQEFLKYFLEAFTNGRSLCIAVGYARKQLAMLEDDFPCASWLPVIVQNQLEMPPTWQSLGVTRSPYRGLMAFREEDADNFFGREAFIEQLVIDVNRKPLVAVIGASGSGKSSVVFAGLIPQLRRDENTQWQIISFRPGKNPFDIMSGGFDGERGNWGKSALRDYLLRGTALKNAKLFIKNQKGNITLSSNAQIFIQESIRQEKFSVFRLAASSMFIAPITLILLFTLFIIVSTSVSLIISSTSEAQKNALRDKYRQTLKATQGQKSNSKRIEAFIALARENHDSSYDVNDFSDYVFAGENFSFLNFNGLPMERVEFQRSDLRKSTFLNTTLSGANFSSAKMQDTQLARANLIGANLSNTNLVNANLVEADLRKAILPQSNLSGANLTCANLIDADLTSTNLKGAKINHIIYSSQTKFSNSDQGFLSSPNVNKYLIAPKSNLRNAKLQDANLNGAKLANADLINANLRYADLTNVDLSKANLRNTNLRNANLTNADLRNVDLTNADLTYANLTNAKLGEANLTKANLTHANLTEADLTNTNLTDATLIQAQFYSAKNLTFQQLILATTSKYAYYGDDLPKTFPVSFREELDISFFIERKPSFFFKEKRLECQ